MGILSCIYNLIVRSGILHRLMWLFSPLFFMYVRNTHNGERVKDEGGDTMNVTYWNGRAMAPFGPRMYSKIKNMNIRKDDVIICGYPKSGCHWAHEILHMLVNRKAEVSKYGKIFQGMMEALPEIFLDSVPSPRVLNTHVFYDELPSAITKHQNKILLTIRCPKDTVVSFYNHTRNIPVYDYKGTFENYFRMFVNGQVDEGCYFHFYRTWQKTMESQQQQEQQQKEKQIFFLSFEDLKEDPVTKILEIADFLGHPASREFAQEVADVTSFSKLKNKRGGSNLFRKGVVGDWKNWLTDDQANEIDVLWREKMDGFKMPSDSVTPYCASKR